MIHLFLILFILCVNKSNALEYIGNCSTNVEASEMVVYKEYLLAIDKSFTSSGDSRLYIIDISLPSKPISLSSCILEGIEGCRSIAIRDNLAYITAQTINKIWIVNLSNPEQPQSQGTYGYTSNGGDDEIEINGNYAYLFGDGSISILDISDPENIESLYADAYPPTDYGDCEVANGYVYAISQDSMHIVDITNPASPSTVGSIPLPSCSNLYPRIDLYGNYAYIAFHNNGILQVDISIPSSPSLVSSYDIGKVTDLDIIDDTLYCLVIVNDYNSYIHSFSFRNDFSLHHEDSCKLETCSWGPDLCYRMTSLGKYAFVNDWNGNEIGIVYLGITIPVAPTLSSPSNGSTGIAVDTTLSWDASNGAISYSIQVSTVENFATTVTDQSGITNTSYSESGLELDTKYYWRVNATNAAGTSDWSNVWNFTTTTTSILPSIFKLHSFHYSICSNIIRYKLPKQCFVSIKYYDMRGRVVGLYVNKFQQPGYYTVNMPLSSLSQGIYIQEFKAGEFFKKDKLTIIH